MNADSASYRSQQVNASHGFTRFLYAVANTPLRSFYRTAMKNQLRLGGANVLNICSVSFVSGSGAGQLGHATFPSSYATNVFRAHPVSSLTGCTRYSSSD